MSLRIREPGYDWKEKSRNSMENSIAPTEVTKPVITSVHAQSALFGLIKQPAVMSAFCWRGWILPAWAAAPSATSWAWITGGNGRVFGDDVLLLKSLRTVWMIWLLAAAISWFTAAGKGKWLHWLLKALLGQHVRVRSTTSRRWVADWSWWTVSCQHWTDFWQGWAWITCTTDERGTLTMTNGSISDPDAGDPR